MVLSDEYDRIRHWMDFITVASACLVVTAIPVCYFGVTCLLLPLYFAGWIIGTWIEMTNDTWLVHDKHVSCYELSRK